jgi:hypothetical protein
MEKLQESANVFHAVALEALGQSKPGTPEYRLALAAMTALGNFADAVAAEKSRAELGY